MKDQMRFSLKTSSYVLEEKKKGLLINFLSFFSFFFGFLGPHLRHMEVARLEVKLELQLPTTATATATWDPICICNLHHTSWQRWIPNPLSKARDWTCILMNTSQICFHWATIGPPPLIYFQWLRLYSLHVKLCVVCVCVCVCVYWE